MRKNLFKAIYDLILITTKRLRLLPKFTLLPAIAVAFTQYWPTIRALLGAMSVEGRLISIKIPQSKVQRRFKSFQIK
jgi:hypothetical protein